MGLTVLPQLAEILDAVDASERPLDEMKLAGELKAALSNVVALGIDEQKGAIAEIEALRFQRPHGPESRRTWGIYWSELASAETREGKTVYFPDIADIDEAIVTHWISRSTDVRHPVLRARYADLAWEFGGFLKNQNKTSSLIVPFTLTGYAVDAYLEAVRRELAEDQFHSWQFLDRAISLAGATNDSTRMQRSKEALFAYYGKVENAGEKFLWWKFDDITWMRRRVLALTPSEKQFLIDGLGRALVRHADMDEKSSFDPHLATSAADRLARRLAEAGDESGARQAIKTAGAAFERVAEQASGLLALAWLEDLIPRYRNAGMTDDAARVERAIRARAHEAEKEAKRVEVPITIPKGELDQWVDQIAGESLQAALNNVAVSFLVREESTRKLLESMASKAPLMAHIPIAVLGSDGLSKAKVGSIEDDMQGRAIVQAADLFNWQAPWLQFAIDRITTRHGMNLDGLSTHLEKSPLLPSSRQALLREGISAWLAGDHVKAIHVIVPQIEAALRDLLAGLGAPVVRHDPRTGGFEYPGIGWVLNHEVFREKVPTDIRFHFAALYCDPRGINLRNHLAHGLARPEMFGSGLSNWVVHSLLVIAMLGLRRNAAGDGPAGQPPETT